MEEVVTLNVGGVKYSTTLTTLRSVPDSMLAAMFSGRFPVQRDADGFVFIDRDGPAFRYILNFLRTREIVLPEGDAALARQVEIEAEYFLIAPLLRVSSGSLLLNAEQEAQLLSWIGKGSKLRLLYRGSRDGFGAGSFHRLCDGKGATVTVISSGGNVFGGFAARSWCTPKGDEDAECSKGSGGSEFLFSFRTPYSKVPQRFPAQYSSNNLFCDTQLGPTFGGRERRRRSGILQLGQARSEGVFFARTTHDLKISDCCNVSTRSTCNLPQSFKDPYGRGNVTFTGSSRFTVDEIEVLLVV